MKKYYKLKNETTGLYLTAGSKEFNCTLIEVAGGFGNLEDAETWLEAVMQPMQYYSIVPVYIKFR